MIAKIFIIILLTLNNTAFAVGFDIVKDPWTFAELKVHYKNLVQQLTTLKRQAMDITKQLQDMDKQVKQLTNSKYDWRSLQNDLSNLGDIISKTRGIAYSASNLDKTFSEIFPGYQNNQQYIKQYENIVNAAQNTLNGVLQLISRTASDFQDAKKRIEDLKNASESAVGGTSAIQAANQIAIEQIEQLQLLRQTITAQANAQTIYYAAQMQKEAGNKVELDDVVAKGKKSKITGILNDHPIEESKITNLWLVPQTISST